MYYFYNSHEWSRQHLFNKIPWLKGTYLAVIIPMTALMLFEVKTYWYYYHKKSENKLFRTQLIDAFKVSLISKVCIII